jgi:phosphoglycolate phosphatase
MIDFVMFDADGVLFDSDESNIAYYNAIFERIGEPPLTPEEERACVFLAGGQVFEGRAKGDLEKVKLMHELGRSLDFAPFFKLLRPPIELRPFMLELKRRYRLGLATNRSATIPAVIDHLNLSDVFDAVASTRDDVRPKPAPDVLELCMKRAGAKPEVSVYVGDSEVDSQAATAARCLFLGVGARVKSQNWVEKLIHLPAMLEGLVPQIGKGA